MQLFILRESWNLRQFWIDYGELFRDWFERKVRCYKTGNNKEMFNFAPFNTREKILATLFVARQVRTWAVKRATSLFNSFCNNVRNQLHVFVARLCINRSTSVSPGLHVWNLWKTYEMLRRPPIYTVNHLLLFIIAVIKFWRFAEYW